MKSHPSSSLPLVRIAFVARLLLLFVLSAPAFAGTKFKEIPRGVVVETERYRAEITDGALTGFFNKLTNEEYLSGAEALAPLAPHIPSGLGTQDGAAAFAAAGRLFAWHWEEHPANLDLPNQHFANAKSSVAWKLSKDGGTLEYTGLTDGKQTFPDEKFTMAVRVDESTGDLLLTPGGESPRKGVYGADLTIAPTNIGVSVEAPIFDGLRLTSDMASTLWHNKWPENWDYAFLALNGSRRGAVGVWAQDAELRYKDLFFLPAADNGGIALSLGTMNLPPFEKLNHATGVTWRIQAFDRSWAQSAARFREWRKKEVKIAPRPEWTRHISFVNSGVNASKNWVDILSAYLNGEHLERTVTFAPIIRAAAFDTKHWDNTPYANFKSDMQAWKASGAKLMAYLQPMIMWGHPDPNDKAAQEVVALHRDADTRSVFQNPIAVKPFIDQHHLGDAAWQAWFLKWVHSYIQDYGADGVYHDQSYPAPVDARGLVNGMTPPQGMADYFYKAATQNPDSIHGSEHLQECNTYGASLGIASGVLWGPAPNMRKQRQLHPSPVTNSLHYPNATLWAFPHYSDFGTHGDATIYHWGMDLMEGRAELAGLALQNGTLYSGKSAPFEYWRNELKLDRDRSLLFVHYGLRPVYPEDWAKNTLSYFHGANGEDFRYEKMDWGSRFVQVSGEGTKVQYGRAHGVTHAPGPKHGGGNVAGWIFYNSEGPSGFLPERYYVLDPAVIRPPVYFSPAFRVLPDAPVEKSFYEHYVEDGAANGNIAFLKVKPIPSVGNIIKSDKIHLHAPEAPKIIWVNGKETAATSSQVGGETVYEIPFRSPATICVLLKEPAEGLADLNKIKDSILARAVSSVNLDVFDAAWCTTKLEAGKFLQPETKQQIPSLNTPRPLFPGVNIQQVYLPMKAPVSDANGTASKGGSLKLYFQAAAGALPEWTINGVEQANGINPMTIPFKAGETKIVSVSCPVEFAIATEWSEDQ